MSQQPKRNLHILAVPVQVEGHINGMVRLAQSISLQEGVIVSFVYPAHYHSLAQKRNELVALQKYPQLRLEVVEDGLHLEEKEALTYDAFHASIPIFQNAVKLLLHNLLHPAEHSSGLNLPPPCCIVSDTFCSWMQALADTVALPRIEFWTSTAAVFSMGSQLASLISGGVLPLPKSCWADSENKWIADAPLIDSVPGLPPFPVTDLPYEFVYPEDLSNPDLQAMVASFAHIREAHTILVHSVYELESEVLDSLQSVGYPIHAVGPLLDSGIEASTPTPADKAKHECLEWLDKQLPASVVYVALGTLAKFSAAERHALALGLEASGHPFLWIIRRDAIVDTLDSALPEGFLQRTIEKGLGLIVSWAPQREVLSHGSVGVFFSHCGWNSTLESIWEGVPMVACPRAGEQRSNARWIAEKWKIGVELERQVDGSFTKEAVQSALKEVMASECMPEGQSYKEGALKAKTLARSAVQNGGTSHSNLVSFCQHLHQSFTA